MVTLHAHKTRWEPCITNQAHLLVSMGPQATLFRLYQPICVDEGKTMGPLCGTLFGGVLFEVDLPKAIAVLSENQEDRAEKLLQQLLALGVEKLNPHRRLLDNASRYGTAHTYLFGPIRIPLTHSPRSTWVLSSGKILIS